MMKKFSMIVMIAVMLMAAGSQSFAADRRSGAVGVQVGIQSHGSHTVAVAGGGALKLDFKSAPIFKLDYDWYHDSGKDAWNFAVTYSNPDIADKSLPAGTKADADIWQISFHHKWFVDAPVEGAGKGVYLGAGLGWEMLDISAADYDEDELDLNLFMGYEGHGGTLLEVMWTPNERSLAGTAGYRF